MATVDKYGIHMGLHCSVSIAKTTVKIWLPHGQLWAIIEATASLNQC